ncbi:MAG TPA: FkbM family methyltransferase [Candidatus Andersenbacteria bacterium]|nr:FkbM family methyltransferase [Candidatus Andersenbacteria bacterium]
MEAPISIGPIQSTLLDYDYLVPLINKHGIIIDAGAHIGEFAFTAEFILKAKKVYSFEPIKESFQRLQKNSKYQTFHAAISASDTQKMYIPFYNIMSSGERNSVSDREETVPSIQLDAMPELLEQRCIDLFKIDVEGMEYDVLDTSKEILKKCRYIMMEVSINRPMTRPSLITIRLLMDILPNVELIHIGKVFGNAKRADAADLLFKNNDYSPKS